MFIYFMMLAGFLATLGGAIVYTDSQTSRTVANQEARSKSIYQVNNVIELIRTELRQVARETGLSIGEIRQQLQCHLITTTRPLCEGVTIHPAVQALTEMHAPLNQTRIGQYRIVRASEPEDDSQYVEAEIDTSAQASMSIAPVTIRLNLGQSAVFANALTTSHSKCTFCHAVVYGDVAQYGDVPIHAPLQTYVYGTWWATGKDVPLRGQTKLTENVAAPPYFPTASPLPTPGADTSSTDAISPFYFESLTDLLSIPSPPPVNACGGIQRQNISWVKAKQWVFEHTGRNLPWNLIRQSFEIPKFDPSMNEFMSFGFIKAGYLGAVRVVVQNDGEPNPKMQEWDQYPPSHAPGSTTSHLNTNSVRAIVLRGTSTKPLEITGRVFFPGDVMISGYIKGKGEILSARNIYIPDDLVYVNPPSVFDGSAASNAKLASMATPDQSAILAHEMENEANRDRVALFATGSIIIGNPFPDPTPAGSSPVMGDERYMSMVSMDLYRGQTALERETGYVLHREATSPTEGCYGRPWAPKQECYKDTESEFSTKVRLTPGIDPNDLSLSNRDFYLKNGFWSLTKQFDEQILPYYIDKNVDLGDPSANPLRAWVTRDDLASPLGSCAFTVAHRGYTKCAAAYDASSDGDREIARAESQPALATGDTRRLRTKAISLPIMSSNYLSSANPYDPQSWKPDQVTQDLVDSVFGTDIQNVSVRCQGVTCPVSGTVPLRQKIESFVDLCKKIAEGSNAASNPARMPNIGLNGRDKQSFNNSLGWLNLMYNGESTVPWGVPGKDFAYYDANFAPATSDVSRQFNGIDCKMFYFKEDQVALFKINLHSQTNGASCEEGLITNACSDFQYNSYWQASPSNNFGNIVGYLGSPAGSAPPTTKCSNDLPELIGPAPGVPALWRPDRQDVKGAADLAIAIEYAGGPSAQSAGGGPVISLNTRYWDKAKLPARNIVRKIHGFLYANEYIGVFADTTSDRELRVYGGMIAREVVGRFANRLGHETDYTGISTATPAPPGGLPGAPRITNNIGDLATINAINSPQRYVYPSAGLSRDFGSMNPSLVLAKDPRFEFRTGLIDRAFLRYEFKD